MSRIAIIIVNYRTPSLVVNCLASLASDKSVTSMSRVVVVENCSGDDSWHHLQQAIKQQGWNQWVDLLCASENRGFGAGNNLAIRHLLHQEQYASPEYIMCLNPDTIVPVDAIGRLADALDRSPTIGIIGSQLQDASGQVQRSIHPLPTARSEFCDVVRLSVANRLLLNGLASKDLHALPGANWVSGAALMIRASVLRRIGLFDERFFLYFEEVDLCRRACNAGYEVQLAGDSIITHLEGSSTGTRGSLARSPSWIASRRTYFRKHHGAFGLGAANIARAIGKAAAYLLEPLRVRLRGQEVTPTNAVELSRQRASGNAEPGNATFTSRAGDFA